MDTQTLTDSVQQYNDGLITGYELVTAVHTWIRAQDINALKAEHDGEHNTLAETIDPGAAIVFGSVKTD